MNRLVWKTFLGALLAVSVGTGCAVDDTYSFCANDSDCADADDRCYEVTVPAAGTSGQFCSHPCDTPAGILCESNFGHAGECYEIQGAEPLCYQTCFADSDCYLSSVCIEVVLTDGRTDSICLPNES